MSDEVKDRCASSCARENVQGHAQAPEFEKCANCAGSSNSNQTRQIPAVDREALAAVIHERFNMARGRGGVAPLALANQIIASGILLDAVEVEARGLENFADRTEGFYPTEMFPVPSDEQYAALSTALTRSNLTLDRFSADLMRRAAGLARLAAQQVRESTPEVPNTEEAYRG